VKLALKEKQEQLVQPGHVVQELPEKKVQLALKEKLGLVVRKENKVEMGVIVFDS
jgi:hypothetical protein